MKSGKRHITDGMELPNQDKIRSLGENETCKYLGILEADTIEQVEMKDKIQKEYCRRTRKLLDSQIVASWGRNFRTWLFCKKGNKWLKICLIWIVDVNITLVYAS